MEKNFPVARLNVTSKKSVSIRLVYSVIVLTLLKRVIMFFPFLLDIRLPLLLIAASPSSLYDTTLLNVPMVH